MKMGSHNLAPGRQGRGASVVQCSVLAASNFRGIKSASYAALAASLVLNGHLRWVVESMRHIIEFRSSCF